MPKRKVDAASEKAPSTTKMDVDGADDDSGTDDGASIINVDFEWFDPDPTIDFHGLKTLLRQLFDVDNQLFDLSALADLILTQQPRIGSSVKCDGKESDPYAFLSVIDLHQHRDKPVVRTLTQYLVEKASGHEMEQLKTLLSSESKDHVGLLISERFINMPHAIVPPLYSMLTSEMQKANMQFSHFIILSKAYTEVASQLDAEPAQPSSKKSKKAAAAAAASAEVFYFHPEDEALHQHAVAKTGFDYTKHDDEGASDSKRAFQELGVRPQGHMILIEGEKFESAVAAVSKYLGTE